MSGTGSNIGSAGVRGWVNRHAIAVILAVVVVMGAAVWAVWALTRPDMAWWAVAGLRELVVERADLLPPINRDGKTLVVVNVYGCGDCDEPNRFIAWYMKYTDEAKAELEQYYASLDPELKGFDHGDYWIMRRGRYVSTDGRTWVLWESPAYYDLVDHVIKKCGERKLVYCGP